MRSLECATIIKPRLNNQQRNETKMIIKSTTLKLTDTIIRIHELIESCAPYEDIVNDISLEIESVIAQSNTGGLE